MTKPQTRTYQAQTITPPSLKPVKRARSAPEMRDEQIGNQSLELEEREQKLDIINRLIDCIKSI
jgi:hypothetical protein